MSLLMIVARHETLSTIYSCTFFVIYIYKQVYILVIGKKNNITYVIYYLLLISYC